MTTFTFIVQVFVIISSLQSVLGNKHHIQPVTPVSTFFANHTLFAAMISTDPSLANILGRDFHKVPQGVNGSASENAVLRYYFIDLYSFLVYYLVPAFWYFISFTYHSEWRTVARWLKIFPLKLNSGGVCLRSLVLDVKVTIKQVCPIFNYPYYGYHVNVWSLWLTR